MKKQEPLRKKILKHTEDFILEHGRSQVSVAVLCKEMKIKEAAFFSVFPSIEAVEKAIWKEWIDQVIDAVSSGAEWHGFSARERYLAFLFSWTQAALPKRSLLLVSFARTCQHDNPSRLEGLRSSFREFAAAIIERGRETREIAERGPLVSLYPEVLYLHWRWVLDFYLKDESEGFERTDAFIEKTVGFAFDLLRSQAIDSAADLARFLLPKMPWFQGFGGR